MWIRWNNKRSIRCRWICFRSLDVFYFRSFYNFDDFNRWSWWFNSGYRWCQQFKFMFMIVITIWQMCCWYWFDCSLKNKMNSLEKKNIISYMFVFVRFFRWFRIGMNPGNILAFGRMTTSSLWHYDIQTSESNSFFRMCQ